MKHKKLYFSIVIVFSAVVFFACDKYEGEISGDVVYKDAAGDTHIAAGAIVSKIQLNGEKETTVAKEKTDTNGHYLFTYTIKGSWKIAGRLEIDSLVYEGVSEVVTINGTNKEVRNMVLVPVENKGNNE